MKKITLLFCYAIPNLTSSKSFVFPLPSRLHKHWKPFDEVLCPIDNKTATSQIWTRNGNYFLKNLKPFDFCKSQALSLFWVMYWILKNYSDALRLPHSEMFLSLLLTSNFSLAFSLIFHTIWLLALYQNTFHHNIHGTLEYIPS